jgi:hypothetical protein
MPMGFIKIMWKLKGLFAFLAMGGLVVGGMAFFLGKSKEADAAVEAPTVTEANRFEDKEPNDKLGKAQKTKKTLTKDEWIQLDGTFASSSDRDRFRFGVGEGVNAYEVQTWKEHKETGELGAHTGMLGMNRFPLTIVMYDAKGKVLTNQLLAASGGGAMLKEGTTRVELVVSGVEPKDQHGPKEYRAGKKYRLYLKAVHKEPRPKADKPAS